MSDETYPEEFLEPRPYAATPEPSVESLARSVRRLRIWLGVVSAFLVFAVLGGCGLFVVALYGIGAIPYAVTDMTVPDEELDSVRQDFEEGFGAQIDTLDVRAVEMEYGTTPFPLSLFSGMGKEEAVYVECHLNGTDVVIANLVSSMYGMDPETAGMIPTKGSLSSRMTQEQFTAFLVAYGKETASPLGAVRHYSDLDQMMYDGASVADTVTVGGEEYAADELWAGVEGVVIEGDSMDMTAESSFTCDALIFHEDADTGEFTFLGTEQTSAMW